MPIIQKITQIRSDTVDSQIYQSASEGGGLVLNIITTFLEADGITKVSETPPWTFVIPAEELKIIAASAPVGATMYAANKHAIYQYLLDKGVLIGEIK